MIPFLRFQDPRSVCFKICKNPDYKNRSLSAPSFCLLSSCLLFLLLIRNYLALTLKILIFAFSYLFLRLDSLNTHKAGLFYPLDLATALRLLILSYRSRADIFVIEGTRMLGQKKNVCFWSNGLYNFCSSASNKNKSTNSFLCIIANKILW